jgi:hypothetical protein
MKNKVLYIGSNLDEKLEEDALIIAEYYCETRSRSEKRTSGKQFLNLIEQE